MLQGEVFSPVLFKVYASDQSTNTNTFVAEFSNDNAIISIHYSPITASLYFQNHVDLMSIWYKKWRFNVNKSKFKHTTFTHRIPPGPEIFFDNIRIPSSKTVKFLGLMIEPRLIWSHYIRAKRLILHASVCCKHLLQKINIRN